MRRGRPSASGQRAALSDPYARAEARRAGSDHGLFCVVVDVLRAAFVFGQLVDVDRRGSVPYSPFIGHITELVLRDGRAPAVLGFLVAAAPGSMSR